MPDHRPQAVDQIEHALGHPASWQTSANSSPDSGAISDGFNTMLHPASSAGATLQAIWFIGQFHGVISPQTPIPSCTIRVLPREYSQTISSAA